MVPIVFLPSLSYPDSLELMDKYRHGVERDNTQAVILVLEYNAVITMGLRSSVEDLKVSQEYLKEKNITFHLSKRGGKLTAHGPGQCVVYPVVPVRSVRGHVKLLEDAVVAICADYGVNARGDASRPGVWVGDKKIASIGVQFSRGVASHGIAFNVCNSMDLFETIVPCGLEGVAMTSLQLESPQVLPPFQTIARQLAEYLAKQW